MWWNSILVVQTLPQKQQWRAHHKNNLARVGSGTGIRLLFPIVLPFYDYNYLMLCLDRAISDNLK